MITALTEFDRAVSALRDPDAEVRVLVDGRGWGWAVTTTLDGQDLIVDLDDDGQTTITASPRMILEVEER